MKTMYKVAMLITIISLFALPAYAADGATDEAGEKVTITGSGGGGNLEFIPSANTLVAWSTTASAYTIGTASKKTTTKDGIEYAMTSEYNGFYQKKQAVDGSVTAQTSAGSLTGSDWIAMGGGGSS